MLEYVLASHVLKPRVSKRDLRWEFNMPFIVKIHTRAKMLSLENS